MFDQFKQLAQLKKIKDMVDKEKKEVVVDGVRVVVNGNMEIEEIELNPQLSVEEQAKAIKRCVNNAFIQIKNEIAIKMRSANLGI